MAFAVTFSLPKSGRGKPVGRWFMVLYDCSRDTGLGGWGAAGGQFPGRAGALLKWSDKAVGELACWGRGL